MLSRWRCLLPAQWSAWSADPPTGQKKESHKLFSDPVCICTHVHWIIVTTWSALTHVFFLFCNCKSLENYYYIGTWHGGNPARNFWAIVAYSCSQNELSHCLWCESYVFVLTLEPNSADVETVQYLQRCFTLLGIRESRLEISPIKEKNIKAFNQISVLLEAQEIQFSRNLCVELWGGLRNGELCQVCRAESSRDLHWRTWYRCGEEKTLCSDPA